jgi:hypothetical protein
MKKYFITIALLLVSVSVFSQELPGYQGIYPSLFIRDTTASRTVRPVMASPGYEMPITGTVSTTLSGTISTSETAAATGTTTTISVSSTSQTITAIANRKNILIKLLSTGEAWLNIGGTVATVSSGLPITSLYSDDDIGPLIPIAIIASTAFDAVVVQH